MNSTAGGLRLLIRAGAAYDRAMSEAAIRAPFQLAPPAVIEGAYDEPEAVQALI